MAKYRGFVGQVAPLGALRYEQNGGERYYVRPPVIQVPPTPYIAPEPAPILEPIKTTGYIYDPSQQEITAPQYAEGGDGTATEIERTAKIDEAMQRLKDAEGKSIPIALKPAAAKPAMPALLPLAIGAGLIWLMS